MSDFRIEDRITLLHDMPAHTAGEHGTVHGTYGEYVGVCFDNSPHLIRYTTPSNLAPATHDVEDVTRPAEAAVLHIIETAWDIDTPCSWPEGCDIAAVWWYEHDCGSIIYSCEKHRIRQDRANERRLNTGRLSICRTCDNNTPNPLPWRAL